jgi:hypothetical protein
MGFNLALVLVLAVVVLTVVLALGLSPALDWWEARREARRARAELAHQAAMRAWLVCQQEVETERRVRQAAQAAVARMVAEGRAAGGQGPGRS